MEKSAEKTIKILKKTDKSEISLIKDTDTGNLFIEKKLKRKSDIYDKLKALKHPYLPEIFDVKVSEEITLREEYIEGKSIAEADLDEREMKNAICEVCEVLEYLHKEGIIHRDVKPSNILIASDSHIRLIDFDVARSVKLEKDRDTEYFGTRGFAAPEQYGFSQTDEKSDIYSVGMTIKSLYEGKVTSAKIGKVIKKCTEINPKDRFHTCAEIKRALEKSKIENMVTDFNEKIGVKAKIGIAVFAISFILIVATLFQETPQKTPVVEKLLFYSGSEENIFLSSEEIYANGEIASMSVVLDEENDILCELSIQRDTPNGLYLRSQINAFSQNLTDGFWEYEYDTIFDEMGDLSEKYYAQISVLDLDGDGKKEVIACAGNMLTESVYAVFSYETDQKELVYIGFLEGQEYAYCEDGAIIVPYGSQGLFTEYKLVDKQIIQTYPDL